MDNISKTIEEYNPNQKRKILIVYVVMIADIFINKKLNPIVTALFIRRRIIHQMLTFKTLCIYIKNALQNHILFWLLTLLLYEVILHISERIFKKEHTN